MGESVPVDIGAALGGVLVARDDREMGCDVAVRHRNTGIRRRADGTRDSRHDLERDTRVGQRLELLAPAPEDERIAALEPDDGRAGGAARNEQRVDLVLGHLGVSRLLADVDPLRRRWRELDQRRVYEPVVHDDVGA